MTQISTLPNLGAYGFAPAPQSHGLRLLLMLAALLALVALAFFFLRKTGHAQPVVASGTTSHNPDDFKLDPATGLRTT